MELSLQPGVVIGLGFSAALALLGPVAAALALRRWTGAPWAALGLGALTFFVSQIVLRLPWQIAIGVWQKENFARSPGLLMAWLGFSCLTAGLFEETGRYVAFRRFLGRERSWRSGVMFGVGHGGLEAMVLVGLSLAANVALYVLLASQVPLPLPPEAREAIVRQFATLTPGLALLGGVERISSMCVHVGLSLAVLRAVSAGRRRWYWAAVAFHAVSNLAGVVTTKNFGAYAGEAVIALFAATAVAFIVRERALESPSVGMSASRLLEVGGATPSAGGR